MKKSIGLIILVVLIIAAVFALGAQVDASATASSLEKRLLGMGLPVAAVRASSRVPLRIEVDLRTNSKDAKLDYGDIWNAHLAEREIIVNYRIGARISHYLISFIDAQGQRIGSFEADININGLSPTFGKSALDNAQTADVAQKNLDLGGFLLSNIDVRSINAAQDTGQILEITLKAKDQNTAGLYMDTFAPSLQQFLYIGQKSFGTYIVLCHVIIMDDQGNILGESVEDVENRITSGKGINIGRPHVVFLDTPDTPSSPLGTVTPTP